MTKEDRFDDETVEPEVIICLPRGSDPAPELVPRATPMGLGVVSAEADTPDPRQQFRIEPLDELPTLPTLGHGRPPPQAGTQPVIAQYMYKLTTLPTQVDRYDRPPPRTGTGPECDFHRPQQADLMDTVAQLQFGIYALKFVQPGQSTSAKGTPPVQSKPVAFTSMKVPKFSGVTSWDQYRQVFDAIVCLNGWEDATVAVQLLSHRRGTY